MMPLARVDRQRPFSPQHPNKSWQPRSSTASHTRSRLLHQHIGGSPNASCKTGHVTIHSVAKR